MNKARRRKQRERRRSEVWGGFDPEEGEHGPSARWDIRTPSDLHFMRQSFGAFAGYFRAEREENSGLETSLEILGNFGTGSDLTNL